MTTHRRGWQAYTATALAAIVVYLAVPAAPGWESAFSVAIQSSFAAAVLVGVRRVPEGDRAPWLFFGLGLLCTAAASLPVQVGGDWLAVDGPDLSDLLYLAFYPSVATGLALMIRQSRRRLDRAALVDALTVACGIGLLAWAYSIEPALRDDTTALATRLVTIAYPIADLVLLAMTILLVRSNGREGRRAPLLVAVAVVGYLAGDCIWVVLPHVNEGWADFWWTARLVNCVYLLSLLVLTLAIVWPRVRGDGGGAGAVSHLTRLQLATLTLAMLMSPTLLITQELTGGIVDGLAIGIGSAIMFLLVMVRFTQLLKQAERQSALVRELSRRDELTGLHNRRSWNDEFPMFLARARAENIPVVVGMIDLDHFKHFNDTYGHPAGDQLLRSAAQAWTGELRAYDVLARYGGEEFIVLLTGLSLTEAVTAVERLRAVTPLDQTFSAGLAEWDFEEPADDLVARADKALYAAKNSGRDRVCTAGSLLSAAQD
ncbi:GGDEF domain-containing protein [Actinoplanes sp. LDG1-06]|uniref:GGDEF domain-containing protein n=1 Tax=Paractinoplanes ovalisporus TaxID=2810368 RepID=A0ABS2A7N7_9ACTN|nr:GGDEF domain-containing protein [Actinoplanes ovalisporus]MBM2615852.1 GGDEF domain-containing protein [Actinoplanes ovalisporus]